MKKQYLVLNRVQFCDTQTLGALFLMEEGGWINQEFTTLELPWKNNEREVSCIPAGEYNARVRTSPRYGKHLHITRVTGRSHILIHHGNFHTDILGCILIGDSHRDINADGLLDVVNSKASMARLLKNLTTDELRIIINDK